MPEVTVWLLFHQTGSTTQVDTLCKPQLLLYHIIHAQANGSLQEAANGEGGDAARLGQLCQVCLWP